PIARCGVRQEMRMEELDRDSPIQPLVMGTPDVGHAAMTDPLLESVAVEEDARRREFGRGRVRAGAAGSPNVPAGSSPCWSLVHVSLIARWRGLSGTAEA